MHLQIKKPKRIYLFTVLFIVCLVCHAFAEETGVFLATEGTKAEDIKRILNNFADKKFDTYLNEVTHYGAIDYHNAICNLFTIYQKRYSNLDACIIKTSEEEKKYSNIWANELVHTFGVDYISSHIESIKNLIINIHQKVSSNLCIAAKKEGFYAETNYIVTVREYFEDFLAFYDSLDNKDKQSYASKKQTAQNVLELLSECPLQNTLFGRQIGSSINLTNQTLIKPAVVKFMVNHPELSKPFNPVIAFNDVIHACGNVSFD